MRDGWETGIHGLHNPDRGYGVFGICFHHTGIPQEESGNFDMLAGTGELFENGVRAVTLSGSEEAVELYRKLGFHDCFHNIIMQYDIPV